MKKDKKMMAGLLCLVLGCMLVMVMLPGCGGTAEDETDYTEETAESEDTAEDSSDTSDATDTTDYSYADESSIDISTLAGEDGVDVDLTVLSSTMVYSVVNDMLVRPNEYIGKVVKMNGQMSVYYDEDTGNTYYACIIMDATACCAQGIEFTATEGDYPEDGEEVTVTGTYGLYEEDGVQYCMLADSVIS